MCCDVCVCVYVCRVSVYVYKCGMYECVFMSVDVVCKCTGGEYCLEGFVVGVCGVW